MELFQQINEDADVFKTIQQENELFEYYGFDPSEVVTSEYLTEIESAAQARAGERTWIQDIADKQKPKDPSMRRSPDDRKVPSDKVEMSSDKVRGEQTSPEVGDFVVLPSGRIAQVRKNFNGLVTLRDKESGKEGKLKEEKLKRSARKTKGGKVIWAIAR